MSNLKAKDADSNNKYIKAFGAGTDTDPFVIEHSDSAVLTKLDNLSTTANQLVQIARLEQISDALAQIKTYTDGLEALISTLNNYINGLETLLTTANSTQTSIGGFVDQLEGFVDGVEPKLESILTELQYKAKLTDIQPVAVSNFPATQPVSGTVEVNNFPATQPVSVNNFPATQAVFGTVAISNFPTQPTNNIVEVSNFPTTQDINGTVGVNNFPATQTIAGTVGVNNFPVIQLITDNQTTYTETIFTLLANATFTGSGRDAQNKNTVRGWAWTNVNGTLYFEQSINNTTWRPIEILSVPGSATQATRFVFRLNARYYRFRYINGPSNQTVFELISTVFGIGL
ncbi:MAG: hypothetical protein ACRC2V_10780 [Xenococcaceae cyanobacterium]